MPDKPQDRAQFIVDRKRRSFDWLTNNFYPEWEQVFKSYKAERDPAKDHNGKTDPEQTSIGMPDTWAHVRRTVARGTAQIPHVKFRGNDPDLADVIGRTIMHQWDKGGIQRLQKRHMAQASLFGWSVRPWWWSVEEYTRRRRIDPMSPDMTPDVLKQIASTYGVPLRSLTADNGSGQVVLSQLLAKNGRGKLLPIEYKYKAYEGPRCDFLFVGDCYPEPNFQTLQSSNWFIVERRRNKEWLQRIAQRFPEMAAGVASLMESYPDGTPPMDSLGTRDARNLRQRMNVAINRTTNEQDYGSTSGLSKEWTITEMYTPGASGKLTFIGEEDVWIGEMPLPYDLDGKIPFTELVLIDDLLCGIGDSTARIMRGLQQLHDRQVNARFDLVYNIIRPLMGTTDNELYENPDLLTRHKGMRLVKMRGQGDLWVQGEQAAGAAVAVGLQDESAIERQFQKLTGDSNMSMNSNVDPQQSRTATGARIMAFNQDILSKDLTDMFTATSIVADAEMMYLMNRSELADAVVFDGSMYDRDYSSTDQGKLRQVFIQAEPKDFQVDGEITVVEGSTLADDDEAKVAKAQTLFQAAMSRPDLFNQQKARDEFLIAMGKGKELQQWQAPPPPPPPPPELKSSLSVSVKMETLPPAVQEEILSKSGLVPPPQPPMPPPGMGPGGPPPGGPPPGGPPPGALTLPPPPPEDPNYAASSYAAARGHSPFDKGPPQ